MNASRCAGVRTWITSSTMAGVAKTGQPFTEQPPQGTRVQQPQQQERQQRAQQPQQQQPRQGMRAQQPQQRTQQQAMSWQQQRGWLQQGGGFQGNTFTSTMTTGITSIIAGIRAAGLRSPLYCNCCSAALCTGWDPAGNLKLTPCTIQPIFARSAWRFSTNSFSSTAWQRW